MYLNYGPFYAVYDPVITHRILYTIYIMIVIMYVHITYFVCNAYGSIDSLTVLDSRLRDYKNGNQDELSHGPDFGGEPPLFRPCYNYLISKLRSIPDHSCLRRS
jgi:hypothetical protein